MSTAVDGIRHLARIVTIEDTKECAYPADSIHAARPAGTLWQVVAGKTMTPGDKAVYFEIDTVLDTTHPAFEGIRGKQVTQHLEDGTVFTGVLLKTMTLRGTRSQGLLVELEKFQDGLTPESTQEDVDTYFDGVIIKYDEDADPNAKERPSWAENYPGFVAKTDAERIQNIPPQFFESIDPAEVYATEKIDGMSATFWRDETGALRYANRRNTVKVGEYVEGAHWMFREVLERYHTLFEQLQVGDWVQGEIFCNRIRKGYKFSTGDNADFRVFRASSERVENLFGEVWVPILDLVFPKDGFTALEQADTVESKVAPGCGVEGIVWYFKDRQPRPELAGRAHFKVISNAHLEGKKRFLGRKK